MTTTNQPSHELNIRFPDDIPVAHSYLQRAMKICLDEYDDPNSLKTLLFFYSSLLTHGNYQREEQDILRLWNNCCEDLRNPHYLFCKNDGFCIAAIETVERLQPAAVYHELVGLANVFLRGDPRSTEYDGDYEEDSAYICLGRGYDWILRCALECDVPDHAKGWLQSMYKLQPAAIVDTPGHATAAHNTIKHCLRTAIILGGLEAIRPLLEFYLRQAIAIVKFWANLPLIPDSNSTFTGMPRYDWCIAAYENLWAYFRKDTCDPFSVYSYQTRDLLKHVGYIKVFEECWGFVDSAVRTMSTFDRGIVRSEIRSIPG